MKPILKTLFIAVVTVSSAAFARPEAKVVPGEYLVKFKASSGGASIAHQKIQGKATLKANFHGLGMMQINMKAGPDEKANFEALKNDPDVEYIEPNYVLEKSDVVVSESFERQSYEQFSNSSFASTNPAVYSQNNANTGIDSAWPVLTALDGSHGKIVVAVIDTGLDKNHDVFKAYNSNGSGGTGSLWVNPIEANGSAGVDDDQNGYVDDINGWNFINNSGNFADDDDHGTHVAGIVVGASQNIFARPLQESKIQIMPLKFLDGAGSGSTSNAIRAIYYAVNNGAKVINNSWGGASYSRALHDAITYAYDHKVLVVCAAGNYASDNDAYPMYPANYDVPSNLSVGSTTRFDDLSSFSNYGANTVHIGSPGEYIESTVPGNQMMKMHGTSMAAPFVAGVAALAMREAPSLSGYQIKELILRTGDTNGYLSSLISTSSRIDALYLLQEAQQMVSTASSQPGYKPSYLSERAPASESSGGGGGCGLVKAVTENGPGSGRGSGGGAGVVIGLLMMPLVFWQALRSREPKSKRKYERFKMSSEIRVMVGDKELVGNVNTISEGGLSFNTEAALEKGGIVTMRIQSPDGHESIEVQGHVVWNEKNQAYGVQFDNAKQGALAMIRDWSASLVKSN
ncbi:S8 family serine peptidase [Bdellovibrio reynosensis]|uniref:S8 family serine peptidase n=1 Tax=Bdellovibrio reynosensis TaxID=2835041 RepID=A0ABY4C9Y0_9BACT|nr:S8 family serine peptidase [Bdellovibrio reynosensis]UOF01594.1 S8 family serine peptidase [Bdellovibrio reynosensis]